MSSPYAGYQQSLGYSALKDRRIIGASMTGAVAIPDDGVILGSSSSGNLDTSIYSGMVLQINAGRAMVAGYTFINPNSVQKTVAAATGYARRDLVIARIYDTEAGDASSKSEIEIVQGSTTADPAIPQNSLILHQVNVPASGTAITLTERRKSYTVAAGGRKQVWGIANLAASSVPAGSTAFDLSTGINWQSSGGQWYRTGAVQVAQGSVTNNDSTDAHYGWVDRVFNGINLPSFANTVIVTASIEIDATNSAIFDVRVGFDNQEILHTVVNSNGAGERSYTFMAAIANRSAGNHDLAWIGVYNGAGGPAYFKGAVYSWVALG